MAVGIIVARQRRTGGYKGKRVNWCGYKEREKNKLSESLCLGTVFSPGLCITDVLSRMSDAEAHYVIGVDVGGTNTDTAILCGNQVLEQVKSVLLIIWIWHYYFLQESILQVGKLGFYH